MTACIELCETIDMCSSLAQYVSKPAKTLWIHHHHKIVCLMVFTDYFHVYSTSEIILAVLQN